MNVCETGKGNKYWKLAFPSFILLIYIQQFFFFFFLRYLFIYLFIYLFGQYF